MGLMSWEFLPDWIRWVDENPEIGPKRPKPSQRQGDRAMGVSEYNEIVPMLQPKILDEIEDEVLRSWNKHGDHAMINPNLSTIERLAILGEEFGEVCKVLTYDSGEGRPELRKELIQLSTMAACWANALDEE